MLRREDSGPVPGCGGCWRASRRALGSDRAAHGHRASLAAAGRSRRVGGRLTDCPRSREPRPPTRTAAASDRYPGTSRHAATSETGLAGMRGRRRALDRAGPCPGRREPRVRRANLRGRRPLASSPSSRARSAPAPAALADVPWQPHRPPPAGAGSVVNRCGGGWSAGGRRAVRPRRKPRRRARHLPSTAPANATRPSPSTATPAGTATPGSRMAPQSRARSRGGKPEMSGEPGKIDARPKRWRHEHRKHNPPHRNEPRGLEEETRPRLRKMPHERSRSQASRSFRRPVGGSGEATAATHPYASPGSRAPR